MLSRSCRAGRLRSARAAVPAAAAGKLNVITTTEDLASLAREVGGDRIDVEALARGYQDPHFVEPKPSFILKLNKADLLIVVGRELEIGWLPPLITQSRNAKIQPGGGRLPGRVADREDPRAADRADHPGDGRRAPAGEPALLARPGQRPPDRAGDPEEAVGAAARATPRTSPARYADFDRRLTEAEKRWDARWRRTRG